MKKVVILIATVLSVALVQGATVEWKMGTSVKAPNADGTIGTVNADKGTLSMYVWLVDQGTFDAATADSIINDYSGKLDSATASVKDKAGIMGGAAITDGLNFSTETETTYYGIVLTQYKSGDIEMFAGNKASAIISTAGTKATVTNLSKTWGGLVNGSAVVWANTPEPSSALLLILGASIFALRRKQK